MKSRLGHGRTGLPAQALVEFCLIALPSILLLLATLDFGICCYQRSYIDYQLTVATGSAETIESDGDADESVRDLLCSGTALDPKLMKVTHAKVRLIDNHDTVAGDSTARALGADMTTRIARFVRVDANVSYPIGLGLGAKSHFYSRHVIKTVAVERRFEIS